MAAACSLPAASASSTSSSPATASSSSTTAWTVEQDKLFEKALAQLEQETPTRWDEIAALVPGKSSSDVKQHYEALVRDIRHIEAGLVALPCYKDEQNAESPVAAGAATTTPSAAAVAAPLTKRALPSSSSTSLYQNGTTSSVAGNGVGSSSKNSKSQDQERRKGIPWTEEEHRLFLLGLEKFGKGDWRSISRNFVVSRTPTQVASHAQKYFIRLNSIHKDKRRTSIHDITSVNGDGRQPTQGPITGQAGPTPGAAAGAAATGQPTSGANQQTPAASAAYSSTPVPGTPVPGYGARGHVSRPVVQGTPMHMAYPMPQPAMHH